MSGRDDATDTTTDGSTESRCLSYGGIEIRVHCGATCQHYGSRLVRYVSGESRTE